MKYIIFVYKPNKYLNEKRCNDMGVDLRANIPMSIYTWTTEEERHAILEKYEEQKKINPYIYPYESLNEELCPIDSLDEFDYSDANVYPYISLDLDHITDWDAFGPLLHDYLAERGFHADVQMSPNGVHLIIKTMYLVEIRRAIKHFVHDYNIPRSAFLVDLATPWIAIDGIDTKIGKIKTIKNWV